MTVVVWWDCLEATLRERAVPNEDFIIRVHCEVCAAYVIVAKTRLHRRGFSPALRDQQVLPLDLISTRLGYSNDKAIGPYFVRHWPTWFPALGKRSTFVRRAANLRAVKCQFLRHWADTLGSTSHLIHSAKAFRRFQWDASLIHFG